MNPVAAALRLLIRCYTLLLSPVLPPSCRYLPTCSEYAQEAVTRHGALSGGVLALRRILRCHPWGGWGYDPVPPCEHGCTDDHAHGALHRPERT